MRCITTTKLRYTADMNMMTKKGYVSQMDLEQKNIKKDHIKLSGNIVCLLKTLAELLLNGAKVFLFV